MGTSSGVIEKRCRICGVNVAGQKRTKDTAGNYYCQPCYEAARSGEATEPSDDLGDLASLAAIVGTRELYPCPDCGKLLSQDRMDASGVCIECARFPKTAALAKSSSTRPSFWKTDTGLITAIITPVAAIGLIVVAWFLWSSHAQQQIHDHLAEMKSKADGELAAGDPDSAATQYAGLLRYAKDHHWTDDPQLLADAEHQEGIAQARATQQQSQNVVQQQQVLAAAAKGQQDDVAPAHQAPVAPAPIPVAFVWPSQIDATNVAAVLQNIGKLGDAPDAGSKASLLRTRLVDAAPFIQVAEEDGLGAVDDVRFSPSGNRVLVRTPDQQKRKWAWYSLDLATKQWGKAARISDGNFCLLTDQTVVYAMFDEQLLMMDLNTGKQIQEIAVPVDQQSKGGGYAALASSRSGKVFAMAGPYTFTNDSEAHPAYLFNAETGQSIGVLTGQDNEIDHLEFSKDTSTLVSVGAMGKIVCWNVSTGAVTMRLNGLCSKAIAVTDDDVILCNRQWEFLDGIALKDGKMVFHTDLKGQGFLMSASQDGTVALIGRAVNDPATPKASRVQILNPRTGDVLTEIDGVFVKSHGAVSADGSCVAVGGNGVLKVYARDPSTEAWRKDAIAQCDSIINRINTPTVASGNGGNEQSLLGGDAAARAAQQLSARQSGLNSQEAARNAEIDRNRKLEEARAETGPGTPRAIAGELLESLKTREIIRSYKFINYFEPSGVHQWDRLPQNMNEICLRYRFEFVTQAGLLRQYDGYIVCHKQGQWSLVVGNIDGMGDISAQVLKNGGFVIR